MTRESPPREPEAEIDLTPLVIALANLARESMADARRGLDVLERLSPGVTAEIIRAFRALDREAARGGRH